MTRRATDTWVRLMCRLYEGCLRALPGTVRGRDGQAMAELFRRLAVESRDRSRIGLILVWLRCTFDILVQATRLRLGGRRNGPVPGAGHGPTAERAGDRPEQLRGSRWWAGLLDSIRADGRFALRGLRRQPGFAVLAAGTFALGIGATTAIFSVVEEVLLRPLPYETPDRIVRLMGTRRGVVNLEGTLAYLNYHDIAERTTSFDVSSAYDEWRPNLTDGGNPVLINAAQVNPGFFEVFGVRPAAGRFFRPEEDVDGRDRVVVLSWGLWQSRWGGDPGVVGRAIHLNGLAHTVVGIAPRRFEDPMLSGGAWGRPALWRPLGYGGLPPEDQPSRGSSSFVAVAKLASGATIESARAELASLSSALEAEYPGQNETVGMTAMPVRDTIVGDVRGWLLVLLGAVGFVLAIAAANVGGLLLGRASERRSEVAIRAALGASSRRIVGQTLVEALIVAGLGGVLGVGVALAGTRWMGVLVRQFVPRTDELGVNLAVLGFTLAATVTAGLVCAVLPAMLTAGADPRATLGETARGSSGGERSGRFRRGLVTAEVTLAIVLLVGAGLLGRTLWNVMRVDVGIDTAGLLTFDVAPPSSDYPDAAAVGAFYDDLFERLRGLPGVGSVAAINIAPLSGSFDGTRVMLPDRPDPDERVSAQVRTVTPGYFATTGLDLVAGRQLEDTDRAGNAPVVVVTQALAHAMWPGEDPLGRRFSIVDTTVQVVGVVADIKHLHLEEPSPPMVFFPYDQQLVAWHGRHMTVFMRVAGEPLVLAGGVRSTLTAIDARLPITNLHTMDAVVASAAAAPRFRALLFLAFATLALLLAAIGIYGVVSFSVARRTREMAIRMALGARPREVVGLLFRDGLAPVLFGAALGLLAAWALSRVLATLLFGVSATDAGVFIIVPTLLLGVAVLATLLPARRAVRAEPMNILRES